MIGAAASLSLDVGKKAACKALKVPRASYYRHLNPTESIPDRPAPPLSLSSTEKTRIL